MRNPLLYVLFLCSGAAGLVYELVWVRELIFVLGQTTYAITIVLVAFLGGLGLGSYLAGRWCYRVQRPGRVFGMLEIGVGLYTIVVPFLLNVAAPIYRGLHAPLADWPWLLNLVRFCIAGLILFVPTTLMGAALPVLVRYVTRQGSALGRSVGDLYGINTLGAVLGTLGAGCFFIPALGLLHATWLAAAINIMVGIAAMNLLHAPAAGKPAPTGPPAAVRQRAGLVRRMVLVGFAVSGFAGMVYQITWTRALVMAVGPTTYAFTCTAAAFILGLALGSLAMARWADRWKSPVAAFGVLALLSGLVAVVSVPIQGRIPLVAEALINKYFMSYGVLLIWQFLLMIGVTLVPTFLMGAVFPLVIRALAAEGEEPAAATGRAYLVNTLGTIAGALLAGLVLIRSDVLGVQSSGLLASLLNGLSGATLVVLARPATGPALARRAVFPAVALLLILAVAIGAGRWDRQALTAAPFMMQGTSAAQRDIVYYGEGVDATVTVEHPQGAPQWLTLRVDGVPEGSTAPSNPGNLITLLLLGHVPALLTPDARSACMVGLGSGLPLGALACHRSFERLDCVELSDDVIQAAALFSPYTYNVLTRDPRVHLIRADGRDHLLLTDRTYDLIVTQPSRPWVSGAANQFTREYFELGWQRLTENGRLAVWLPGYQSAVPDLQMIVKTLFDVFEHVSLWQLTDQDFLAFASRRPQHIHWEEFTRRFRVPTVRADLYRVCLRQPADILGRYITGDQPLREWAQAAPVHTDDNALLEFSAPRHMYASDRAIAYALFPLQRPVLSDLVSDVTLPPGLNEELAAVVASRWATLRAQALADGQDWAGALRLLADSFRGSPQNIELYTFLMSSRRNMQSAPRLAGNAEIGALLAQIAQLPPPLLLAPLTGAALTEIAARLRSVAQGAAQRGQWPDAVSLLSEARDLEPDNLDTARLLADALARVGRLGEAAGLLDEILQRRPNDGAASYARAVLAVQANDFETALRQLESALKWGALTPEALAKDDALQALRDDARFQELLRRSRTDQPKPQSP